MDPELRGVIFDNKIYFGREPLDLPFYVKLAKIIDETELYIIDTNNNLWLCVSENHDKDVFEYDENEMAKPVLTQITKGLNVVDVIQNVRSSILILTADGKLFFHDFVYFDEIKLGVELVSISFKREKIIGIDREGNLWKGTTFENFKQYTKDIRFLQAETNDDNLICLNDEGYLYVMGTNRNYDICCDEQLIPVLTKISTPIQFKKIFRERLFTAFIDTENNLWLCGHPFLSIGIRQRLDADLKLHFVIANVADVSIGRKYLMAHLLDGTLMIYSSKPWPINDNGNFSPDTFNVVNGIEVDRLFNNMDTRDRRFRKTKSARK